MTRRQMLTALIAAPFVRVPTMAPAETVGYVMAIHPGPYPQTTVTQGDHTHTIMHDHASHLNHIHGYTTGARYE